MSNIQSYDMRIVSKTLSALDFNFDLFIAAGGSDYRAYELLRLCRRGNVSIGEVLLFDFAERRPNPVDNGSSYRSYEGIGFPIRLVECSIFDPSSCLKNLENKGIRIEGSQRLALDISCFTKPYFFTLLRYLSENVGVRIITIFYTEPMSYKTLGGGFHSTYGPLRVIEIPGFPGMQVGTSETVLVVLLGFDGELSSFIYEQVSPDDVFVVNGFPAYSPKFKDISLVSNERIVESAGRQRHYITANNPFETFNLLATLKKSRPRTFFNVAPLGTKPMALGACMFALAHPSVRIVYPLPERYEEKTTNDCWHSWSYRILLETRQQSKDRE